MINITDIPSKIKTNLHYGILTPLIYRIWLTDSRIIDREELKGICNQAIPFGQSETFNISTSNSADDCTITNVIGKHSFNQPFVAVVPNATLIGPYGVTVSSEGQYIIENSLTSRVKLAYGLRQALPVLFKQGSEQNVDTAVSLVGPRVNNYYHWVVHYLTKLQGIEKYTETNKRDLTILIPPNPPGWIPETLENMGYGDEITEYNGKRATVNRLIVPTGAFNSDYSDSGPRIEPPSRLQWLRSRMSKKNKKASEKSNYIYISRSDATERKVRNENEVLNALPSEFRSYNLSNMTISEQVDLFNGAEMVVAPHGAGLANILWGWNISVMELYGIRDVPVFYQISQALGHNYVRKECEVVKNDLIVDTDKLLRCINSFAE